MAGTPVPLFRFQEGPRLVGIKGLSLITKYFKQCVVCVTPWDVFEN